MHADSSDGGERKSVDGEPAPEVVTTQSTTKSILGSARAKLAAASAQATSTGATIASKVATISTAGASKTAEVGKQTLGVAGGATRGAIETTRQAYSGSKLESVVNAIDGELDQRGAKKAVKETAGAVVDKLDQVTGKRLIELLEAKLQTQDTYNDVLATRLAEALERVAKLEARVGELENGLGTRHEH
jgi:hypothetical protein